MKALLRTVDDHGHHYEALMIWCPAPDVDNHSTGQCGLHMLAVSGDSHGRPMWQFDGNLEAPTLNPSILTRMGTVRNYICHSYVKNGNWEFLSDCTHSMAGKTVPLPDLPDWITDGSAVV